jgi:hypothetical protein
VRTAVEILVAVRGIAPRVIDVKSPSGIDRDWGTDALRAGILSGQGAEEIMDTWSVPTQHFREMRDAYLLY